MYVGCDQRKVPAENGRAAIYNRANRTAFLKSDSVNFREMRLFEYVCCCFSSKSLRARNRGRVRVEKLPAFSPFPTMFYCLPKTNFISIITIILSSANVSIWTSLKFCRLVELNRMICTDQWTCGIITTYST